MPCRLEEKILISQRFTSQIYSRTVYDHPHIPEKAVDNLESLRCRRPSLIKGESVQPLKNRIDLIPSEKLLYEFLCISLRKKNESAKTYSLGRPWLIYFVASARVERSSTIIFTTIPVMAGVGGTFV
jgi:hypothetical protein